MGVKIKGVWNFSLDFVLIPKIPLWDWFLGLPGVPYPTPDRYGILEGL